MSREPLRLGLIGCGAISQSYAKALETSSEARIVAVADTRADAARALAEQVGCPHHDDYRKMLDTVACDAVIVCTPPVTHRPICLEAIERKLHVMCEKPLDVDSDGAKQMVKAAEDAGVTLSMSSKFRYVEDVIRAKSVIAAGILGDVILFENTFASRVDMSTRWNADPEISGGGVLIDNGTHSVDLIRYFLGPIAVVQAVEGRRIQSLPVEDTARIFVRSEAGVMGGIDLSWSLDKATTSFIDVYGSHGTLRVGWKESKYRQMGSPDWVVFGNGYNKVEAFRRLIENFCRTVRGEERSLITAEDAVASVEAIEAAYQSLEKQGWTPVDGRQNKRSLRAVRSASARPEGPAPA